MTEVIVPAEIQLLLDEKDVEQIIIAIEGLGDTERDRRLVSIVRNAANKDALIAYLANWVIEHASFKQLDDLVGVAFHNQSKLIRQMALVATPDQARTWVQTVLKNTGHELNLGWYDRKQIKVFMQAARERDSAYAWAVIEGLIPFLKLERSENKEVLQFLMQKALSKDSA